MKPIPGYERYLASIDGDITGVRGWVLEPGRPLNGYLTVGLYAKGDKNPTTLYLHRVIAATYLGLDLLDTDTQVNHKNGLSSYCKSCWSTYIQSRRSHK